MATIPLGTSSCSRPCGRALWSVFAIALLQVRTPSLALARAACVGVLGLRLAGICGAFCPDQPFLERWSATSSGNALAEIGGLPASAFCFGALTTLIFAGSAAAIALGGPRRGTIRPVLPALMLVVLLAPGVALQSFGTSWLVFFAWLLGTAVGAYAGVAIAIAARNRFARA